MSGDHNMNQKLSTADYHAWLDSPLTKALKQSHQTEIDAIVKDSDRAFDLLRRAETEMRYAGWNKYEADNSARNGVYEQIVRFLK
jgi:coproporphyrinogen III oxidase-like Fe-S oxidoreductase